MSHITSSKDSSELWENQEKLAKTFSSDICIGVDEVGRGCLAGPVVAAAIAFRNVKNLAIRDSKELSEKKRREIFTKILEYKLFFGVGLVSQHTIDKINILNATKLAMRKAILKCTKEISKILTPKNPLILIDGNFIVNDIGYRQISIVNGDSKIAVIAASSIIAKVVRDEMMRALDKIYPQYLFSKNKGYGTKEHIIAISKFGFSSLHRLTFNVK